MNFNQVLIYFFSNPLGFARHSSWPENKKLSYDGITNYNILVDGKRTEGYHPTTEDFTQSEWSIV